MNKKRFFKLLGLCAGLSLAVGAGVAVGSTYYSKPSIVHAAEGATHDFSQDISQLLNNGNVPNDIVINNPGYSVKQVIITGSHNKNFTITATVTVGGDNLGSGSLGGSSWTNTTIGDGKSSLSGDITVSFSSTLTSTGKGTLKITKVTLVEGVSSSSDPDDATLTSLIKVSDPSNLSYYSDATESDIDPAGASLKAHYTSPTDGTWSNDVILKNSDLDWSIDMTTLKLTATYTDDDNDTASYEWTVTDLGERPLSVTYDTTKQNYTNEQVISSWTGSGITVSFAKGTNSNASKYYTSGTAIRAYGGNTITVSSLVNNITHVSFTFGSSDGSNAITANVGTWSSPEWTGESDSVTFTVGGSSGNRRIQALDIDYEVKPVITPSKAVVSFNEGWGTYYNGDKTSNNTFSTEHITVKTYDNDGTLAATYAAGTGYKVTINGTVLDSTSEVKTISFSGASAGSHTVSVVVPGVGADGADVNNSAQSPAVSLTVIAKTPSSYEWTNAQTTVFYAHRDTFSIDGALKITFNDTSYSNFMSNFEHKIHAYDESAANHAGDEVTLPTHSDGSLNVDHDSQYVLDIWHKDYSSGLHEYVDFTVKVPTLKITDNYTGNYYVGATRALDVTVTATFEKETSRVLSDSEYTLSQNSVTPENTDSIEVTASWVIDEITVDTAVLTINPQVSTRTLNDIAVSDQTLSAGSYFVLSEGAITLDVTENEVNDLEELDQSLVTITKDDKTYTSADRIKKSDAGTFNVSYSEGGKPVTCTFTLSVSDAVVGEISSSQAIVYNKITSTDDLGNGEYLIVCESVNEALNTASNGYEAGQEVEIVSNKITGSNAINSGTITLTSKTGGYSIQAKDGTYLGHTGSKNTLNTSSTDSFTITISFDDNGNVQLNCGTDRVLRRNSNNSMYRFYGSGQKQLQLYKQVTETVYSGDKVTYLKSVIDAYRLNSGSEGNVCNAQSGIYSSSEWTKAKAVYASLTSEEIADLSVQDYFGEVGKTYVNTYDMLIANDPLNLNASSRFADALSFDGSNSSTIIVIVSLLSISAVGGYLFLRRRNEQ